MKRMITQRVQSLLMIPKLSTPMALVLLFGVFLTVFIMNQVQVIQHNTTLLKSEVVPAFEKSTKNITLLKNISEHLTFATLTAEEDMVMEIQDDATIQENLLDILSHNETLRLERVDVYLAGFQDYFEAARQYTLNSIRENELSDEGETTTQALLNKYNQVHQGFIQLNVDIEDEIANRTALIEKTSMRLVYFTVAYIVILAIVLFVTSDYHVIQAQRKELAKVNRNVQNSLEYASLIQEAILPRQQLMDGYMKESFVFWLPKDTVGGDIYFVSELESKEEIIVMVIDGVGHGVSGAFLTILTKALETQMIEQIRQGTLSRSPAAILSYFNVAIKTMLKQETSSKSNVGFDGGVLYYNRLTQACHYAGAKTPLYIVNGGELEVLKSDRKSVGFIRTPLDQRYTEYTIEIKEGTKLYIATDGITDQEGANESRYGKARLEQFILEHCNQPFDQQLSLLRESYEELKGSLEQSDDITVVGLEFQPTNPHAS